MMNAYDKMYLETARNNLGRMLEYAVYDLGFEIEVFWDLFVNSDVAERFSRGDVSVIVGRSGVELALEVANITNDYEAPSYFESKSEEYWTGWALAYYQWNTGLNFRTISNSISINEIKLLYSPYHEMDIRQFCDKVYEICFEYKTYTNLKSRRLLAGLSQSELAKLTGIPVRTIQQYEQGQKDINNARSEYIVALASVLCCEPRSLLEVRRQN